MLRLVGEGLVHDVAGGYLLNREHLAAPVVDLLANLPRRARGTNPRRDTTVGGTDRFTDRIHWL